MVVISSISSTSVVVVVIIITIVIIISTTLLVVSSVVIAVIVSTTMLVVVIIVVSSSSKVLVVLLVLFQLVKDLVTHSDVFNLSTSYVHFSVLDEFFTFTVHLDTFGQGEVHIRVTVDQVTVDGFTSFQLDQHGLALCRG